MERISSNCVESSINEPWYLDMYDSSGMLTTYDELKERIVKAQGKSKDSTTDRLL